MPSMLRHNRRVLTSFFYRFTRDACIFSNRYAGRKAISMLEDGYSDRALISASMAHLFGLADCPVDEQWWNNENLVLATRKGVELTRDGRQDHPATERSGWLVLGSMTLWASNNGSRMGVAYFGLSEEMATSLQDAVAENIGGFLPAEVPAMDKGKIDPERGLEGYPTIDFDDFKPTKLFIGNIHYGLDDEALITEFMARNYSIAEARIYWLQKRICGCGYVIIASNDQAEHLGQYCRPKFSFCMGNQLADSHNNCSRGFPPAGRIYREYVGASQKPKLSLNCSEFSRKVTNFPWLLQPRSVAISPWQCTRAKLPITDNSFSIDMATCCLENRLNHQEGLVPLRILTIYSFSALRHYTQGPGSE
ncbi:hypothetical protein B0H13DRAFT_1852226 [Mycena leptocephala]|nr:hypothetical protein B0H13DRAFT_1852226 [Mycena leptocephala]